MTSDEYILTIINKYRVTTGTGTPAYNAAQALYPLLKEWAGAQLRQVSFSGSYAKDTAIRGMTDVDLFISLKSDTSNTLKEIFDLLYKKMVNSGYTYAKKQNVSIHITHGGIEIDLVPGVNQAGNTEDHWLYVNKSGRERTQTNVSQHISIVANSSRLNEIRAMKIWRKLHNLEFPSFYLELAVIEALKGCRTDQLADNVWKVLGYLVDTFKDARFVDPANANNIISDDLTAAEKQSIVKQAASSRAQQYWSSIIW
jgi:hypothetical protein